MKISQTNYERKEGGILLLVLLIMLLLAFLAIGLMGLARTDALETSRQLNRARAFWMAEAGLNELKAIVTLEANRRPLERYNLVDENDPVLSRSIDGSGSYEVFVRAAEADNEDDEAAHYSVEAIGRAPGGDASVAVLSSIRLTTVSDHVWVSHTEGNVQFTTGDHIYGSPKTNGKFIINGTPIIYGHASISETELNYTDGRDDTVVDPEVFLAGLTFGAPTTDFEPTLIDEMKDKSGMNAVEGPARVEFLPDGRYVLSHDEVTPAVVDRQWVEGYWQQFWVWKWWVDGYWQEAVISEETRSSISTTNHINNIGQPEADDNIIYVNGDVEVSGTVAGSVSVVSESTISVVDDLVYESAPSGSPKDWNSEPDADQRLGLYAKHKVEIDYADHESTSDGKDVYLHAAIFVTEPPSGVDNPGFGCADRAKDLNDPYIHLYGSIVQYQRGVVGSGGGGFLKDYHQDERFFFAPPPGSPFSSPEFFSWSVENR